LKESHEIFVLGGKFIAIEEKEKIKVFNMDYGMDKGNRQLETNEETIYSSMSFTFSHWPLRFSFHKLTLLSPPLTARMLPLRLQLTRQSTVSNSSVWLVHWPGLDASEVQMRTVLSCEAEAM
jgi:hypothetical protein